MTDQHQVNAIIAAAIMLCRDDVASAKIEPEQAKHIAKSIIAALSDAGLQIVPSQTHS